MQAPSCFSMVRSYTAADLLTLANASCGTLSIFACLSYIAGDRSGYMWSRSSCRWVR